MKIKFLKTHPDAQLPARNHNSYTIPTSGYDSLWAETRTDNVHGYVNLKTCDSGYDVFAVEDTAIPAQGKATVPTGIKVAYITPGFWFKVEARSGLSFKAGVLPHPGVIDSQYRGDLGICLYNHSNMPYNVHKGDRIAQLVVYKVIEAEIDWAEETHETLRGEKGFGSSGS